MKDIPSPLYEILETLSPDQQRLFACDCAEHLLPYFERLQTLDNRPRTAVEVARRYAVGKASSEELEQANNDAESAAWDAADVAWKIGEREGTGVSPIDDTAAPAAVAAESCSALDIGIAIKSVVAMALEVVVTATIGSELADQIGSGSINTVPDAILQQFHQAEAQELAWQLERAHYYAASNSEMT